MSKKKSREEWQTESDRIHNKEFKILEDPISGSQKVKILHKKCMNILEMNLNNHTKRYCKFCSRKNKRTLKEHQILSDKIHNSEFTILEEPSNIKQKVKILHKKCNSVIEMTMNNHLNHKNGCKQCSKYSLKSNSYWIEQCDNIYGKDYQILEEVNNCHTKVEILHTICSRTHYKSMSSFIHNKRGCPYCSRIDVRYAEKYVENYLRSKSIKFETEKTFEGLINPKTGRKLRFDFYLPDYNQVIEVNGIQHYKPIDCWGGEEYYERQIYRDKLKIDFLSKNNIKLYILNNKQLTKINEII